MKPRSCVFFFFLRNKFYILMRSYHSVISRPTDGPQSALWVALRLIAYSLQVYNKTPFVLWLLPWFHNPFMMVNKIQILLQEYTFMPLILKFILCVCWEKVGRWGGLLGYMYSKWPEDWSGVIAILSDSLWAGKVKIPSRLSHLIHLIGLLLISCRNQTLLFESKRKIDVSHQ